MLQDYLNANLLSLMDDGDVKKLKKSAEDVAKKLAKNKAKIVSYTLTAIDPDITADNEEIIEVKDIIVKNWSTFSTNAKDTPLTYIRAVMLEALSNLSKDVSQSLIIWFAGRNIVRYHKLAGKEKEIVLAFLSKFGNDINQRANKEWALSSNYTFSQIEVGLKDVGKYLVNDDTLKKYLEDASGPSNSEGNANFDSPNPYWSNQQQNWSHQFAPRAAKGIKKAIDPSLKAIVDVMNENKNIIQSTLNKTLEDVQNEVANKSKLLQLRSELIWWKEAGYSSSSDKSYDEIDGRVLEIVLARDYSSFIPLSYPKSVDYFLKETYKGLKANTAEEQTIEYSLKTFMERSEELKLILPQQNLLAGKITLLNFINGLVWNKTELTQFEASIGMPLSTKLSPVELTVWLFHDFQLLKILNEK